ncbi:hypothetical protein Bca4012_039610 [Brassica carinata]
MKCFDIYKVYMILIQRKDQVLLFQEVKYNQNKCIQEINSICSAFLWSGPVLSTQRAKVAWEEVCKPKEEGGLGLKNLSDVNKVSCLKLIGRILYARTTLWVKWIWKYLIRKGSFWSVKITSSLGSWMWKKLLNLRPLAKQLIKVEINNGSNTSFWFDNWSPLGSLIDLVGERGSMDLGIPIYSTVETAIQMYRFRRHRTHTLQMIEREVLALRNRGLNQSDDIYLWKRVNGEYQEGFVTSQAWNLIREQSLKVSWFKGVWFSEATQKFAFITWLAARNRLATGDRILRWNPQAISTCWLCKSVIETKDHLFFECNYSKEVWQGTIRNMVSRSNLCQWSNVLQVVVKGLHGKILTFLLRYSFQAVVYALWHERNVRRVREPSRPAVCLIANLDKLIRNRITSLRGRFGGKYERAMEIWFGR